MTAQNPFPTPFENIAIDFLYEWLGECRFNRSMEEYRSIARRLPKTSALHAYVNQRLREVARTCVSPSATLYPAPRSYQICLFKAGDKRIVFDAYPESISLETVRTARKKSGLPALLDWTDDEQPSET
jgi:hypothetical protein